MPMFLKQNQNKNLRILTSCLKPVMSSILLRLNKNFLMSIVIRLLPNSLMQYVILDWVRDEKKEIPIL